ncbi:uncharacterized protein LOC131255777 [Magnolia sinica]|uniref:uncharacterized protein LOC131255777 n=1 Tax=Magnolia sinica TaxID=86752 RepID=UPI00265849BA|nr:uncharacterized protein LOC131255777 [Magnolia sinica]
MLFMQCFEYFCHHFLLQILFFIHKAFDFCRKRYPRSLIKFCWMLVVLDWVSSPRLVKPGGTLVYITCSIDPEENEERVAAFLLKHPDFIIDLADSSVPPDFVTDKGFFFSNPVKHRLDGSFAARLVQYVDHKMNPG